MFKDIEEVIKQVAEIYMERRGGSYEQIAEVL